MCRPLLTAFLALACLLPTPMDVAGSGPPVESDQMAIRAFRKRIAEIKEYQVLPQRVETAVPLSPPPPSFPEAPVLSPSDSLLPQPDTVFYLSGLRNQVQELKLRLARAERQIAAANRQANAAAALSVLGSLLAGLALLLAWLSGNQNRRAPGGMRDRPNGKDGTAPVACGVLRAAGKRLGRSMKWLRWPV